MKLIKIEASGLPLFKDDFEVSFFAQQRVADDDKGYLCEIFDGIYTNCVNAFIGINSSGKTSVLKLVSFSLGLLNGNRINDMDEKTILNGTTHAEINTYVYAKPGKLLKIHTEIEPVTDEEGNTRYIISDEWIREKDANKSVLKKVLCTFNENINPKYVHISTRKRKLFDDQSCIVNRNKKVDESMPSRKIMGREHLDVFSVIDNFPYEALTFLDPNIEYLKPDTIEDKKVLKLKFKKTDEYVIYENSELTNYLSIGAVKGIYTFALAFDALKNGGYILIDEIESHFNREVVSTLFRFFMDGRLNKHGATIIFSTHYPELLDVYDRNDGVIIIRNLDGIDATNLCEILHRNDLKKSEAYQNGSLEGTTIHFDRYKALLKRVAEELK